MNALQKALLANTVFSGLTGLLSVIIPQHIANMLGLSNSFGIRLIGLGLICFAVVLLTESRKTHPKLVPVIVGLDYAWVAGTVLLLVFDLFSISPAGKTIIAVIAFIVLLLARAQWRANKNKPAF